MPLKTPRLSRCLVIQPDSHTREPAGIIRQRLSTSAVSRPARPEPGPSRHRCPHVQTALDDEDLSAYLSVPVATIYKWRTTGEAPRAHKIGRYLRWAPADVFDWLEGKRDAG